MSTSAATQVELLARPATGPPLPGPCSDPASVLAPGGAIKMSQSLLEQPTRVDWHTRIDLNRATHGSQLEFVADSDATLVHERLW